MATQLLKESYDFKNYPVEYALNELLLINEK